MTQLDRELPSYFIIGAKRAGTTSLSEYILQHPAARRTLVEKGCRYYDVNFHRGWDWFVGHFPTVRTFDRIEASSGTRPIVGESSPYYAYHPQAPERIARDFPEARLIFMLREPTERAWSHYRYEVVRGFETLGIHEALDSEAARLSQDDEVARWYAHRHFSYVGRSLYAEQLERLYEHFSREQVLVIKSEDLFSNPRQTMDCVHLHLGLEPFVGSYDVAFKANVGERVPADVRSRLDAVFEESNARLSAITGQRLDWTSS